MLASRLRWLARCRKLALALPLVVLAIVFLKLALQAFEVWGVYTDGKIQAAIERAGSAYRARTGKRPTHVWPPEKARTTTLQLWDLIPFYTEPDGIVKVGRDG